MNNNIKFLSIAIVAVLIVGAGFFLTREEKPKEDAVAIRMLDSSTTVNSWEIVKKLTGRDILEEEGVKLELVTSVQSTGGTQALQALLANNIDYASSAWTAWINAIASGGKIKAVTSSNAPQTKDNPGIGMVVLEKSNIYTAKDIIGKKLAVNVLGAEQEYTTREWLKQNGLSIDEVQLIVVPAPQIMQVLRSGQVDAAAPTMNDQYFLMASKEGGLRQIPGTRNYDLKGENIIGGGGFREIFIKEHPETVKRFVTAHEKSQRLVWEVYQNDPKRVKKVVGEIYAKKGGNLDQGEYYKPWSPEYPFVTDRDIQYWLDIFESEGKLKPGQIKPSDVYTNEFNPYYKN